VVFLSTAINIGMSMKTSGKWVFGMVASLSLATGAHAIVPDSSGQAYRAIPQRNMFGLKEPPPQTGPPVTPAPALPKVILTGLSTILGYNLAFLKVQYPAKPGEPAKEQSLTMKQGEREGDIEVVDIDISKSTVQVNNSGTLMPVTFDKLPATPAPAPAAAPGAAAPPVANLSSNPGMATPTVPNVRTNPFSIRDIINNRRPIPTRTVRLPTPLNSTQPVPPTTPNGTLQPQAAAPQAPIPQGTVSPAEEQLLQELERAAQAPQNPAPQ
jgi:hypothetical protein